MACKTESVERRGALDGCSASSKLLFFKVCDDFVMILMPLLSV